ncbi:hypothetical protein [Kitasatospora griseola]|nr:hypothetical protein [Kitasatospora griseola]GGQ78217.1 hypothetical protein GCM10010195_37310 [Kitasatospora griseola]
MTNSAGLSPNGIPGYEGGPLAHLPEPPTPPPNTPKRLAAALLHHRDLTQ